MNELWTGKLLICCTSNVPWSNRTLYTFRGVVHQRNYRLWVHCPQTCENLRIFVIQRYRTRICCWSHRLAWAFMYLYGSWKEGDVKRMYSSNLHCPSTGTWHGTPLEGAKEGVNMPLVGREFAHVPTMFKRLMIDYDWTSSLKYSFCQCFSGIQGAFFPI